MNKNSKKLGLYIGIVSTVSVAAIVLRILALLLDYDITTAYFNDSLLVTISGFTVLAAILLSIPFALLLSKCKLKADFTSPMTYVPVGALAMSVVTVIIYLLRSANIPSLFGGNLSLPTLLALITALLGLSAIAHLFSTTFYTEQRVTIRSYFAIGTITFMAMLAAFMYFDTKFALNSHAKIVDQMAILFAALFMLYEARISLGREMWRGYAAFGLMAMALSSYASIPNLILYFVKGYTVSLSIELSTFIFTLSVFAFMRLILATRLSEDNEDLATESLNEYREEMRLRSERAKRSEEDEQITIDELFVEETEEEENEKEGGEET